MVSLLVLFLYAMECIFSSWLWCGSDNMSTSNNSPHSSGNNRYDNKVGTECLGPQDDTPYRAPSLEHAESQFLFHSGKGISESLWQLFHLHIYRTAVWQQPLLHRSTGIHTPVLPLPLLHQSNLSYSFTRSTGWHCHRHICSMLWRRTAWKCVKSFRHAVITDWLAKVECLYEWVWGSTCLSWIFL